MPDGHVTHAEPHVAALQHRRQILANSKNTTNGKRSEWSTRRRPPMAFEALVLSRYLPASRGANDSAALPKRRGIFGFLVETVIASRQRAADREVARFRELHGE